MGIQQMRLDEYLPMSLVPALNQLLTKRMKGMRLACPPTLLSLLHLIMLLLLPALRSAMLTTRMALQLRLGVLGMVRRPPALYILGLARGSLLASLLLLLGLQAPPSGSASPSPMPMIAPARAELTAWRGNCTNVYHTDLQL
jgi:hypothetical protein